MRLKLGMAILAGALVSSAYAQLPLSPDQTGSTQTTPELGGEATIDIITIGANTLGIPLRHGGVIGGSERVEFRGRTLKRGEDYQIDVAAGVIYLMRATRAGESVRVAYRWDKEKQAKVSSGQNFSGLAPIKFQIAPGSSFMMGFGMTERLADGNVVQSNLFGWNNKMSFGSTKLNGLLMRGNRDKIKASSDYEYQNTPGATETGSSHFYLQNLVTSLGGGKIELNYQDISKNFAGFAAAQDAGYESGYVDQLRKERGLKRFSLGMHDVGVGGMKVSNSFKSVGDGDGDITWQSYGVAGGGLSFNWSKRAIDESFKRFGDIAEADRDQLKRELGMARETFGAQFAGKASKMSLSMSRIEDHENSAIERRELKIDSGKFKFEYGDQEVEKDFLRMNSLLEGERALWGRELGMRRQWMGLQTALFGGSSLLTFNQSILGNDQGDFRAMDLGIKTNGFSLQHTSLGADAEFDKFDAMQEGERRGHIDKIGRMYAPDGIPVRNEEFHWFNHSGRVQRDLWRLSAAPFKDWNVNFDHLSLAGANGGADLDSISIDGKKFSLKYRDQRLDDSFAELGSLLELERHRLGVVPGLHRTDFSTQFQLSPNRSFLYSSMQAENGQGGVSRTSAAYKDPKLSVSINQRSVDEGFSSANLLVDPEKDLLASMRGFTQTDIKASWNVSATLSLDAFMLNSASESLNQTKYIRDYQLKWNPSKDTSILLRSRDHRDDDPLAILFANTIDHMSLSHRLGKSGLFKFARESQEFDGTQTQLSDWKRWMASYETQINPTTTVSAEAQSTQWDDGEKEDIKTGTVSTTITKRMGVSYSNVDIDRKGEERDEKKRGYGFFYDFGNGMRIAYNYAQHRAGTTALDTSNQGLAITGGNAGNVNVSNGGYSTNQWEGDRTQAKGALALSTIKPMTFLGITNLKLNASMDTQSDRAIWQKEHKDFGLSGNIGSNAISYQFKSQMSPNGFRGVDRTYTFTTDQKETKKLRLNIRYKERSTPFGEKVIIRDYTIAAKPMKGVELQHNLLTHPEVARGDAILGSITTAKRVNRWKLDVNAGADTTIGAQWEEQIDQNVPRTRLGGVNMSLFKKSGSPVNLFYGIEQSDKADGRSTQHRYHLRFDQKPGPNQQFSFFIGNLNTQHGLREGEKRNKISLQLDYQLKF